MAFLHALLSGFDPAARRTLLAAAILATSDAALAERLDAWRQRQTDGVAERPE